MKRRKIIIAVFVILLIAVFPAVKLLHAKKQVASFCQHVTIGASIGGLSQRAKSLGLHVIETKAGQSDSGKIIVWQGWAFARWFCLLEYSDGKISRKNVIFLD